MSHYIFCKIETTGTQDFDRIIQLSLIVFHHSLHSSKPQVFQEPNSTNIEISFEAMERHGITPNMLVGKKKLQDTSGYQMLSKLNNNKNILIIHNRKFILERLQKEGFDNKMKVISTLKCSKYFFSKADNHRLTFLRYELKTYQDEKSEALKLGIRLNYKNQINHLLTTLYILFKQLLPKTMEEALVLQIEQLLRISSSPLLIEKINFGKYKGQNIKDISINDFEYLQWLKNTLDLDEDLKYTIDYYLSESNAMFKELI